MVKTLPLLEAYQRLNLPGTERNLFFSYDWFQVMIKTYGLKLFVKYIEREGQVVSYAVYSVVTNFLEWKICLCSYCDYCDAQVSRWEDWQEIFRSIQNDYPRYRIAVRNLRDEVVRQIPELQELSREKYHLLDIREDLPIIWKRTHDSFRAAVHQAERKGVTVRPCYRTELETFYQLHLWVRKNKYRIFPQPFKFFRHIWEQYIEAGKGVLLGAFSPEGQLIGANMYLSCGNTLYYKFNTSHRDFLSWRPNNILFWKGIEYAKERGREFLDLGSSGLEQKGLILFKEHAGAQAHDIIHLGYAPAGYRFSKKRILKVMTRTFTFPWVPDAMVRWGSHIIYPYLA